MIDESDQKLLYLCLKFRISFEIVERIIRLVIFCTFTKKCILEIWYGCGETDFRRRVVNNL